jgi:D-serine deaminase-like pyridoxal phosphate-dependent protein
MQPITRPTLLIDETKCRKNIEMMANKAKQHGVRLRPHFKTHQSLAVGKWFQEAGVEAITVSSLKMATYFAQNGWQDITVAFPFYAQEMAGVNKLAEEIDLNLTIVSPESIKVLKEKLDYAVGAYIKIDVGTHRTGIRPEDGEQIEAMINEILRNPMVIFKGFMAHAGHTYGARSEAEIEQIHQDTLKLMGEIRDTYQEKFDLHDDPLEVSIGDTPTFSVANSFEGAQELRPGNCVFYDVMQTQIGACDADQIAVAMACPVVAKHADRHEVVIHGGAVHFSKDFIVDGNGNKVFGQIVRLTPDGWGEPIPEMHLARLSQEHGIISTSPEAFDTLQTGDVIGVLPIHSCLTANLMRGYRTLTDQTIDHLEGQPV